VTQIVLVVAQAAAGSSEQSMRGESNVSGIRVRQVTSPADRKAYVDVAFRLNARDSNWAPPLKSEVHGLIDPKKNPWFGHAEAAFFLAERDARVVGRISAQVDQLSHKQPLAQGGGPGVGNWGMFEAEDAAVASELIARAEEWLRTRRVTRSVGPISISIWDEPGLLVEGFDHPPTVMMGHNSPAYEAWIEAGGYRGIKNLYTYAIDYAVDGTKPPLPVVNQIILRGERNPRIRLRQIDKRKFAQEAALILRLLNDAWADNWGFVPLTDAEIAYAGRKLKPIVFNDLIRVAEVDGESVAFIMTLPDLNEMTRDLNGSLFPTGFVKLLWRLNGGLSGRPRVRTMRLPLMGIVRQLHGSPLASEIAFMMIEAVWRASANRYGATRAEMGWILEDNQGMRSIAEAVGGRINKIYRIYEKLLMPQ
jgi:hypothetical protein